MGPYLANPYYAENLKEVEQLEETRKQNFNKILNENQYKLFEQEEKSAEEFSKKILNNFESLVVLFDNFIFEEEYTSLGDEEYLRQKKDFNFLLKLKSENKQNLDLNSKRTFKKIYPGLDKAKLKINYFERFGNLLSPEILSKIKFINIYLY
jgi:hypothetical protein